MGVRNQAQSDAPPMRHSAYAECSTMGTIVILVVSLPTNLSLRMFM